MSPKRAGQASAMKLVTPLEIAVTVVVIAPVKSGVAIGVTTLVSSRSNACGVKPISVEVNTGVHLSLFGGLGVQDSARRLVHNRTPSSLVYTTHYLV